MPKTSHLVTLADVASAEAMLREVDNGRVAADSLSMSPVERARFLHELDADARQATAIIRRSQFKIVE